MTDQGHTETPTEPLGGKPPAGSEPSVSDLGYQVKYQRAFEAVLWSMPAMGIYGFYRAAMDLGAQDNTLLAWSETAKPNAELLTANNQTPYIFSQTDLRKGPVVLDVPAATDKVSLYGQIVDHCGVREDQRGSEPEDDHTRRDSPHSSRTDQHNEPLPEGATS